MIPRSAAVLIEPLTAFACQAPPACRQAPDSRHPQRPTNGVVQIGDTYRFSEEPGVLDQTSARLAARTVSR